MDVTKLKSLIQTKKIPNYMVFTGPEWTVQKVYIEQISKVSGLPIRRVDDISSVFGKIKNRSMLSKSFLYVVRDDKELMNNEQLQHVLPTLLVKDILIHLVTTIDKRTKFYSTHQKQDIIVEFEPLSDTLLSKYIKRHIDLSEKSRSILIDICEHDYGRCLLEIDKIKRFYAWNTAPNITMDDCFRVLVREGTIYEPPYDAIFDCVDAILHRKSRLAFDLLQQAYDAGEATMVLLSVLYTNAKAVLQVQSTDSKDIAKVTGLSGWQVKNAVKHKGKYTNKELENLLLRIQKVERGIKIGTFEEQFAMEYILVKTL